MTTIVFDGRVMAADSKMSGVADDFPVCKMMPFTDAKTKDHYVIGGAGLAEFIPSSFAWFMQDSDPKNYSARDYELLAACHQADGLSDAPFVFTVEGSGSRVGVPEAYGIGSGADYAMGAMAWGAPAIEAVQVAINLDSGSGGEIYAYDLYDRDWIRKPDAETLYRLHYMIDPFLLPKNRTLPQPKTRRKT